MEWFEALLLGLVQGLTEFLPVSSSGHLSMARQFLGVDAEGFLDFTVTVHCATVLSTIVVFRQEIWRLLTGLLKGVFHWEYNDETDYVLKICVSMIPVGIVGVFFKDQVEALFGEGLHTVALFLLVTAALLCFSDFFTQKQRVRTAYRGGISYWQAFVIGIGQALAVAPGLSRSGTTISTGLICGVDRKDIAQFSFLMVLAPILGEQLLDAVKMVGSEAPVAAGVGVPALLIGFAAAFLSGLFACRAMIALVRRARLRWFALYCALAAAALFLFA